MSTEADSRPDRLIKDLIERNQASELEKYLDGLTTRDISFAIAHMTSDELIAMVKMLTPEFAAGFLEDIPEIQALDLFKNLEKEEAASILDEMESDEQADIIGELDKEFAEEVLSEMEPEEAADARKLIQYDDHVAGGLMITEFASFPEHTTVVELKSQLNQNPEKYHNFPVQYIYVKEPSGKLIGVVRLLDLLIAKPETTIREIMIQAPHHVTALTGLNELKDFFKDYDFIGVPVVDHRKAMVGVVVRRDVLEASAEISDSELLRTQGITGEEIRTMPTLKRSRSRLAWLSINIVLNVLAASVIAFYEETLSAVIALAVFLPIVSDMSGCSGSQAVAVSIRELSLGITKPFELLRVLMKELSVGIINGFILGIMIGIVAFVWKKNVYFSLVVGSALAMNTVIAVSFGGVIPLLLKKIGMDPALASSPILTTVTDIMGFFLVLSLGALMLPYLQGV